MDAVTSYLTDKILKDIDNLQSTEKKKMPQLYNATPGFQNKTKADLIAGKTNLGAVALGNSHHMLAQSVNLTQKVLKEVEKLNISNLSGIYSQQPNYHDKQTIITLISDWISAMVNAHVDVAKDPYINRLNVRKFTINTTNFLLRAGKGESTFYFLSQKILRDAADKFEAYSGSYGVEDTKFGASYGARRKVREEYSKKAKELLGIDDTQLKEEIEKVYLKENPFNIDYLRSILPTKDTGEWYVSQLAILDVYEKIEPYARALSELTKLSQIDTKKYGNNFALQQNFLIKMAEFSLNNRTFPDPLSVIKNTFLKDKLINGLIRPRKYLGNIFVRTTEAFENKRREIYKILGKDNTTMSDEFINNVTRMMEASYKTDFWINYAKNNGIKVGSLLTGDNSIPKRLYKIKQLILQNPGLNLTNSDGKFSNALLDNINMMIKTDAQMMALPDFIQFKQNKSDDHNLDDHIIRAWEELLDLTVSDSELEPVAKEIREFARDLAVYSFFTSGDAFGRNNIFKYVPNSFRESSGYYDYIRRVEENPSEYISKIRISEILKNLWWSDEVVPPVNVFKQTFEESEYGFSKVLSIDDSVATDILPSSKNIKVNGRDVNVPASFTLNPYKSNKLFIGSNDRDQSLYTPFIKVNIGSANNPLSTEIYRFYGVRLIYSESGITDAPVYVLDSKKGLKFRGCFLAEPAYGYSSLVKTNKNLKYIINDSDVIKNVSFTLYSNDPYNNMGEIEYLEGVLNGTTNTSSNNQDNNVLPITKIISGGQTGVDTIGLQVAKELGIETGGTAPKGFLREEGIDSEDISSYGLTEITPEQQDDYTKRKGKSDPYTGRTELNVRNSDGTVYFSTSDDKAGLIATKRSAEEWSKPFLENPTAEELREWIIKNNIKTLNVAGNRGSKLAKDNNVANILREALSSNTSNAINNTNAVSNEFTWADKADNSYEVSTKGDKRFSALNAKFKPDTVVDGVNVGGRTIEDVYQNVIKKSGKGQAPAKDSIINLSPAKTGKMTFSYGSNKRENVKSSTTIDAIRNRERTATTRYESDGHIEYWQDLKVGDIIEFEGKNGEKVLVRVTKPLTRLSKDVSAEEWSKKEGWSVDYFNTKVKPRINEAYQIEYEYLADNTKESKEDFSYYEGYLPLWQEWARQNPELIEELRENAKGKVLTDMFANTRVSQARALADILNESASVTDTSNDINNTDNTNNTDQSNAITEEASEIKSFDNFVKEAGDAFDEVTVNKVKEDLNKQTTSRNTQPSFTFKDGTTVTTDFELNDQQKFALWELEKFFNSEETVFSLQGYAGTGKTTIMKVFDKYLNNNLSKPLYVSPTHKANAVTRANNPEALAKTIHSLLGLTPNYDVLEDSFDLSKIKFSSSFGINNTVQGTIIIVDESSMLEDSLTDYLVEEAKKNNNRIIFIGDPAQLSPVGQITESKALNYSGKVELTKVERTGDNAILKDATSLRENNTLSYITDLNDKGDGIIYTNKESTLTFFLKNIVNKNNFKNPLELRILAGENKYIPYYNKLIRDLLFGENAPQLVKGDILMGYSNEKRTRDPRKPYEIINSGDYIVDEISDLTEKVVPHTDNKIKVFGYKVSLKNAYDNSNVETFILDSNNNANSIAATKIANLVDGLWSVRDKLLSEGRKKEANKIIITINSINNSFSTMFDIKDVYGKIKKYKTFDYAYTQTVHKSQGATYENVVVLENTFNKFSESEKQKLKYVALTRAKHKVLYFTNAKVNNKDITDVTSSKIKEMQNNAKRLSELGEERQNECK